MRILSVLLVFSMLSNVGLMAGDFGPGYDGIEYGYQPPKIEPPSQYQGYPGQQQDPYYGQSSSHGSYQGQLPPIQIQRNRSERIYRRIQYAPSSMTSFQNQWALGGYNDYHQWHQQGRRQNLGSGYWDYWQDQSRYDHERRMTRMQLRYRDRQIRRMEKRREEQRRHQSRVAGFTMLGMSIPFLISAFD